jgi:hypothetical protein
MRKNRIVPGSSEAAKHPTDAPSTEGVHATTSTPATEPDVDVETDSTDEVSIVELPTHFDVASPCCKALVVVDPLLETNHKGICSSCAVLVDYIAGTWVRALGRASGR